MRRLTLFLAGGVVAAACVAMGVLAAPAWGETTTMKAEIEFSSTHECTHEQVNGNTTVHIVTTTTDNPDGSMHVRVHQQTHGQSLLGAISGDEYVFNNGQDTITDADIFPGERMTVRTEFIHRGENQAFIEVPGLDDLHQRLVIMFGPLGEPIIDSARIECR